MSGVEEVILGGHKGGSSVANHVTSVGLVGGVGVGVGVGEHRCREMWERVDREYVRPCLQSEPEGVDDRLMSLYSDIMIK